MIPAFQETESTGHIDIKVMSRNIERRRRDRCCLGWGKGRMHDELFCWILRVGKPSRQAGIRAGWEKREEVGTEGKLV